METTRNNRSIGDPLTTEPKKSKKRNKKDKNFCHRNKYKHTMAWHKAFGRHDFFRYVIVACTACGKKEWHRMKSLEQEKAFYDILNFQARLTEVIEAAHNEQMV